MARIEHSVEVNLPVQAVYEQWTQFEDFPRFMEGVREVRQLDDAHIQWRAMRHGQEKQWQSEILDQIPCQHIVWRDVDGSGNTGRVNFNAVGEDKTRVQMIMEAAKSSTPAMASQEQEKIRQRLEQDLLRFKTLMERQGGSSGAWQGEIHDAKTQAGATEHAHSEVDATVQAQAAHSHVGLAATGSEAGQNTNKSDADVPGTAQQTTPYEAAQANARAAEKVDIGKTQQPAGDADPRAASASQDSETFQPNRQQSSEEADDSTRQQQGWLPGLLQNWGDDPKAMMRRMTDEMDQLFDRFVGRPMGSRANQGGMPGKWMPTVELSQSENELIVSADLPGLNKDDVAVTLGVGKLIIEGERRQQSTHTTPSGYSRTERSYGQFYRMIPLPEGVDTDAAQASMRDGVLRIQMPFLDEGQRQGRKLDIHRPQ